MTPSAQAKAYGAKSLLAVSASSGYNLDTLRRYAKQKPQRFKALCLASVCDELGIDGHVLRDMHKLQQQIRG